MTQTTGIIYDGDEEQHYVKIDGEKHGPYTEDTLEDLSRSLQAHFQ